MTNPRTDHPVASHANRAAGRAGPAMLIPLLFALISPAGLSLAQENKAPLFIEADAVELDENTSTSLYRGNVVVEQGAMRLFADRVLVEHEANNQPRLVIATGAPARFEQEGEGDQEMVKGLALRMEYEVASDEITFIDEAQVIQGEDRVSSDRITYARAERRVKAGASASGNERVRIRLQSRDQ